MSHSSEETEPNLTPILDMVFQLITFFMLVINFKASALDLTLKLPVLGSARPVEWGGDFEPITLNLNKKGEIAAYGQRVEDFEGFIKKEALMFREKAAAAGNAGQTNDTPVVIRADKEVSFTELNHVIHLCQENGYQRYALSAMTRAEN